MSKVRTRGSLSLLVAVTAGLLVTMGQAQTRGAHGRATLLTSALFVIDQSNSSVSASGTFGSSPIQPQGFGSLTTSYSGAIIADLDLDAGTILFRPETVIAASDSGSWRPLRGGYLGSEPANYGGLAHILIFTVFAALRDGAFSTFTDQPLPLTPVGEGLYSFESTQTVAVISGAFDYNSELGSGSQDMAGFSTQNAAAPGALQDFGDGTFGLTVPVDFTLSASVSGELVSVRLVGSITGVAVPEGASGKAIR